MDDVQALSPPIEDALDRLAEDFEALGDWEQRYRYVIDLGRDLPPLDESEYADENKVRGCASQVWLVAVPDSAGRLTFRGDSDAHIVRGLIAILLGLYSGRSAREILGFDARRAFDRLGLVNALSAQRSNGLFAMVERIRAQALSAQAARPPATSLPERPTTES
jgi:cysteine desulfuration protein SufE